MPTRQSAIARVERGDRIRDIRRATGLNGADFAALLQTTLLANGVDHKYDKAKLSRMETGMRAITLEEAVGLIAIDPERRSYGWLVFGVRKYQNTKNPSPRAK